MWESALDGRQDSDCEKNHTYHRSCLSSSAEKFTRFDVENDVKLGKMM